MIWIGLAFDAANWASLIWQRRQEFEPLLQRIGGLNRFAEAALTNPDSALRRVGNTLVFGQADGGPRVLAFLEQTTTRLDSIDTAVSQVQAGQAAIAGSLASLQTVSMITLGLSALTPVVLTAQFAALNRRLKEISAQIARLQRRFDASVIAKLDAGLRLLRLGRDQGEQGDQLIRRDRLTQAVPLCMEARAYFNELLGEALNQNRLDLAEIRLLSRHFSVAIIGEASCHVELGQDEDAFSKADSEFDLLRRSTERVFHETVGKDPAPFLLPPMREHGVTIESMARLYQQARDAGAIDAGKQNSASAWFEQFREEIFRVKAPRFRSRKHYEELKQRLHMAIAAVEETNRIIGLSRMVDQARESGRATREILERFRRETANHSGTEFPYLVWGLRPQVGFPEGSEKGERSG